MRRQLWALFAVCVAGACARGVLLVDVDGGGDATAPDASGCTPACTSGQVCSNGMCKSACDLPTTKCTLGDGGLVCANLTNDVKHCGQCTTSCSLADAGGLPLGTNNPDAGLPVEGGYDSGSGWSLGSPTCDASTCGIACPTAMTECSDGICYDTQNHHDHCGNCTTACPSTQWCNRGNCCDPGKEYCGSACIDVLSDPSNCGGCANVCPSSAPYCQQGVCVMACVPSGSRAGFTTLSSSTVTGCWKGNPCANDAYNWTTTNGQSFEALNQDFVCGGTTACVAHVGINTYANSGYCQGSWDIYCDTTKVGSINTVGKACQGSAMTNGCSTTFMPVTCSSIKVVATGGSGTQNCCAGPSPDSMIVSVSAW